MRIIICLPFLFASFLCLAQDKIKKVTFNSHIRGSSETITILPDSIIISKGGNQKAEQLSIYSATTQKEWKSILREIKAIDLTQISTLESPTNKRAYDGAKHSKITIYSKQGTYEHRFDDEDPHPILKKLLECIIKIRDLND